MSKSKSAEIEKNNKTKNRIYTAITIFICFCVAFVLWLYVMETENPEYEETFKDIDIEIENSSELTSKTGYTIFSSTDYTTNITVKGQKSILDRISKSDISATADVGNLTETGANSVPVSIILPSGVKLGSADVNNITVYVDEKSSISLEVEAKLSSGTIPNNYECELKPAVDYVEVSGPKTALETLNHALVDLELGDISESMTVISKLKLIDNDGNEFTNRYVSISPSEVSVNVKLYTYSDISLTYNTVHNYYNSQNSKINIEPETIQVKGDPKVLSSIGTSLVVADIDEEEITDNPTVITKEISLPDDVSITSGISNVTITIIQIGTTTKSFEVSNFIAKNVNDELTYTFQSYPINITLRGQADILNSISSNDISASVDLSEYNSSTLATLILKPDISAPSGAYAIGEYKLSVTLAAK